MSSHNSKYYIKKLTKESTSSLKRIDTFFKKKFLAEGEKESSSCSASNKQGGGDLECSTTTDFECSTSFPPKRTRILIDHHETESESTGSSSDSEQINVPDARLFCPLKYEQKYKWLYYSVTHSGYMCKICELFAVVQNDDPKEFITKVRK